jgi:hypothetical protein
MLRQAVVLGAIFTTFASIVSAAQNEPLDFSCATFHAFLTEAELVARFGRGNVSTGAVFGSDDGPVEGTILFATQNDMQVEIVWRRRSPSGLERRTSWQHSQLRHSPDVSAARRRNG